MSENKRVLNERLVDLMLLASTVGLSESEQQELDQLTESIKDRDWLKQEMARLELTAAAFDLSMSGATDEIEEIPVEMHDRLLASAGGFFGKQTPIDEAISGLSADADGELSPTGEQNDLKPGARKTLGFNWREFAAIAFAAACLLLVLSGLNPFVKTDPAKRSPSEKLLQLTQADPGDLLNIQWTPVHDADAHGRVVWSDQKQEGYMVFDNMDVNDPEKEQYQLWIFDTDKGQAYPVDGGVFDIVEGSKQTVVPIKAHLPVKKAVQFAVTVEIPGGVTVSKREKIPVLAAVE